MDGVARHGGPGKAAWQPCCSHGPGFLLPDAKPGRGFWSREVLRAGASRGDPGAELARRLPSVSPEAHQLDARASLPCATRCPEAPPILEHGAEEAAPEAPDQQGVGAVILLAPVRLVWPGVPGSATSLPLRRRAPSAGCARPWLRLLIPEDSVRRVIAWEFARAGGRPGIDRQRPSDPSDAKGRTQREEPEAEVLHGRGRKAGIRPRRAHRRAHLAGASCAVDSHYRVV